MFAFVFARRPRAAHPVAPVQTGAVPARRFFDRHPALDATWRLSAGATIGLVLGLAVIWGGGTVAGRTVTGDNATLPPPTPFWNTPFPMGMAGPTAPLPFLPVSQLASGAP